VSTTTNLHAAGVHDHVVGLYERDQELVAAVVPFLAAALEHDGAAVVVATDAHRRAIAAALRAGGVPVDALTAAGRYQSIDAAATLETLVRDGILDAAAFRDVVCAVLDRAEGAGRPVRVFGEMVGLLWDAGDVATAIELESMWNDLAASRTFALFCAYAMSTLETSADLAAVKRMCERHSSVIPLNENAADACEAGVTSDPAEFDRMFVAVPSALRDVRRFVRDVLRRWGEHEVDGAAEVVASELATNAVQHADSPFRVSISRGSATIRIAVRDTSFVPPEHLYTDAARQGGRGVRLVAALSNEWGVRVEPDGKTVWAEVARAPLP
jgi:anti-sigma regulatory factor (Ser/Thr protein kinase)